MVEAQSIIPASSPRKLLLINPNSSTGATSILAAELSRLPQSPIFQIELYTAPSGPLSIDNAEEGERSARIVLKDLEKDVKKYDAFLIACYSVHPLVPMLEQKLGASLQSVMGIFEASILAALKLLPPVQLDGIKEFGQFGIVTTGKYYEKELKDGALDFLAARGTGTELFFGVESTGLNAIDLHTLDQHVVRKKIKKATKKLVHGRNCGVICLGCAGMMGMEAVVREALVEELGEDGKFVSVVDGIGAAIGILEGIEEGQRGVARMTAR